MNNNEIMDSVLANLASKKLDNNQLERIVNSIKRSPYPVTDINICTHGICLDLAVDGGFDNLDLSKIIDNDLGIVGGVEIFPEGILRTERLRLRITHKV